MFSAEGIGKTIEKAIENALLELKASREDVDIKILNEGGLFKKAKVLVTISDDAKSKYEKRESIRKEIEKEEKVEAEEMPKEEKSSKENKEEKKEIKEDQKPLEQEELVVVTKEEEKIEKFIPPVDFLKGLFEVAGKTVEIKTEEDDKYINISVTGEDLGDMIGHRGDCYYAISKILSVVSGKQDKKILLDIGQFKEKRAESLRQLAKRTAEKVVKSGRYIKLSPMNPSDRRIIHTALQDDDRVTTLSKGVEPHRYVIVFPKEAE